MTVSRLKDKIDKTPDYIVSDFYQNPGLQRRETTGLNVKIQKQVMRSPEGNFKEMVGNHGKNYGCYLSLINDV